jgi:predicted 3-demethylubiquinone-9 3-methyltransferase (glyoxalase superfamily)
MRTLIPFLLFCGEQHGKAEEAVNWYCSIFDDSRVVTIDRYGPGEHEPEGTVRHAEFELGGYRMKAIESAMDHRFTFTPAISLWIDCSSRPELERLATALGERGNMLMPVGDYGFSELFCWVADRFGVTWQLNLPPQEDTPTR